MNLKAFKASLDRGQPPDGLSQPLLALWHAAKGEWDKAHTVAQAEDNATAAWVHAYLHRVEGDLRNAGYWYGRAKRTPSTAPLEDEWNEIAGALL
jgi:hypothetical protein